jgi:hypothetical protein
MKVVTYMRFASHSQITGTPPQQNVTPQATGTPESAGQPDGSKPSRRGETLRPASRKSQPRGPSKVARVRSPAVMRRDSYRPMLRRRNTLRSA